MEEIKLVLTNQNFISAILLTICLIFIGFILTRTKIIPHEAEKVLTSIIMKVAFPCLAFVGFLSDFDVSQFGVLILSFICFLILFLIGKLIFIKVNKQSQNVYRVLFAMGQITLFGLPISQTIYGEKVLASLSMVVFSFRLFLYIYSFFLISKIEFNKDNIKPSLKKTFLNPVMIGMIIGLLFYLLQLIIPNNIEIDGNYYAFIRIDKTLPWLYKIISTIASLASPLGMLLVGITLGRLDIKSAFNNKLAYILSILRSFIAPLIVLGICLIWQLIFKNSSFVLDSDIICSIIICFASPTSVVVNTYCVQYENEAILSSDVILLSTIISIISVPLLFFIIKLLKELLSTIKGISLIKEKTNGLKDKMEVINQKKEKHYKYISVKLDWNSKDL